jgi:membrane protein required for colicin V production
VTLNWLDFVIIILVGLSVAEGIAKGFARTGIGLAATVMGVVLGVWFYGTVGYYLLPYVSSKGIANFLGFIAIFTICVVLGALAGAGLAALLKSVGLSWMDRTLGGLLGVARGAISAIALILILIAFTPKPPPNSVANSHWAPYLVGAANVLAEFAPRELKDAFFESYDKVKEAWNKHVPQKQMKFPETEI